MAGYLLVTAIKCYYCNHLSINSQMASYTNYFVTADAYLTSLHVDHCFVHYHSSHYFQQNVSTSHIESDNSPTLNTYLQYHAVILTNTLCNTFIINLLIRITLSFVMLVIGRLSFVNAGCLIKMGRRVVIMSGFFVVFVVSVAFMLL